MSHLYYTIIWTWNYKLWCCIYSVNSTRMLMQKCCYMNIVSFTYFFFFVWFVCPYPYSAITAKNFYEKFYHKFWKWILTDEININQNWKKKNNIHLWPLITVLSQRTNLQRSDIVDLQYERTLLQVLLSTILYIVLSCFVRLKLWSTLLLLHQRTLLFIWTHDLGGTDGIPELHLSSINFL